MSQSQNAEALRPEPDCLCKPDLAPSTRFLHRLRLRAFVLSDEAQTNLKLSRFQLYKNQKYATAISVTAVKCNRSGRLKKCSLHDNAANGTAANAKAEPKIAVDVTTYQTVRLPAASFIPTTVTRNKRLKVHNVQREPLAKIDWPVFSLALLRFMYVLKSRIIGVETKKTEQAATRPHVKEAVSYQGTFS